MLPALHSQVKNYILRCYANVYFNTINSLSVIYEKGKITERTFRYQNSFHSSKFYSAGVNSSFFPMRQRSIWSACWSLSRTLTHGTEEGSRLSYVWKAIKGISELLPLIPYEYKIQQHVFALLDLDS